MPRAIRRPEVQEFLLRNVTRHPQDLVTFAAQHFGVTRQATFKVLQRLLETGQVHREGRNRGTNYFLPPLHVQREIVPASTEEDVLWRESVAAIVEFLPENIRTIAYHGFTEMVNNVRDHSGSATAIVVLDRDRSKLEIRILDFGIGIFEKIRLYANLENANQAVFELSKGKFTTDPDNHSGEGIFFTSRIFDAFSILSGHLFFSHDRDQSDWLLASREEPSRGTSIFMRIDPSSTHTTQEVFQRFAAEPDGLDFNKTIIAVKLLENSNEPLISRSQAKRLLQRLSRFREVVLDFSGVESIGQAFADEIFRVFVRQNPEVSLAPVHMHPAVSGMVGRAQRALLEQSTRGPDTS